MCSNKNFYAETVGFQFSGTSVALANEATSSSSFKQGKHLHGKQQQDSGYKWWKIEIKSIRNENTTNKYPLAEELYELESILYGTRAGHNNCRQ